MNYGDLIRDAIQITLRNRYLWFFGFFVGLGSGGGGGGGGFFALEGGGGGARFPEVEEARSF